MLKKNTKKIIVTSMTVGILGIGVLFGQSLYSKADDSQTSNQSEAFSILKQDIKDQTKSSDNNIFVTINSETYTKKEYEAYKATNDFMQRVNGNNLLSEKEIEKQFVQSLILEQKAKEENLQVSREKAVEYAKQMREIVDADESEYGKSFYEDYFRALNVTLDEYWNNIAIEEYMKALSVGELKGSIMMNTSTSKNSDITTTDSDMLNELWANFVQKTVNEATVNFN